MRELRVEFLKVDDLTVVGFEPHVDTLSTDPLLFIDLAHSNDHRLELAAISFELVFVLGDIEFP